MPLTSALTQLFGAVYPQRIPFPFDGFTVPGGLAARCSRLFTSRMFTGELDKGFIDGCAVAERNRADRVLVRSWEVLDAEGRLRTRPGNRAVRALVGLFDSWLDTGAGGGAAGQLFQLGDALKLLCEPPYGCNTASAGLVLALFFGSRKDTLTLVKGGQSVSVETWLQSAMPRNYLEQSVVNDTIVVRAENPDEWQRLLDDWAGETTYSGLYDYGLKAKELEARVLPPESLHYLYSSLRTRAEGALRKLAEQEKRVGEALDRVKGGMESKDARLVSWGAADLAKLRKGMEIEESLWTQEQIAVVEGHESESRAQVQEVFPAWLPRQKVSGIGEMAEFLRTMDKIAGNLAVLGFSLEKASLELHVVNVRDHVEFLAKVLSLKSDVSSFIRAAVVSDSTTVVALADLIHKSAEYSSLLTEVRRRNIELARTDLDAAEAQLIEFKNLCEQQIAKHKARLEAVYDSEITNLSDVRSSRAETAALVRLFAGQERDIADLGSVNGELDLVEAHYRQLDDDHLTDDEFELLLRQCIAAANDAFSGELPLFTDPYEGIAATIRTRRRQVAEEWIRTNLSDISSIENAGAERVRDLMGRMRNPPRLLSASQRAKVDRAVTACEERLDRLEVEGLVARLQAVPDESRKTFLKKVRIQGLMDPFCSQFPCGDPSLVSQQGPCGETGCQCPLLRR